MSSTGNPFEYIGIEHNDILENSGCLDDNNVPDMINSINTYQGENFLDMDFLESCGYNQNLNEFTIDNDVLELFNMSNEGEDFVAVFIDYINVNGDNLSFSEIMTYVDGKESEILNNTTINQDERNAILSMIAVYKHSGSYWYNNPPDNIPLGIFKWWRTALVDAAGGLLGTLAGGPVGGVAGAVGCSALDALMQRIGGKTKIKIKPKI